MSLFTQVVSQAVQYPIVYLGLTNVLPNMPIGKRYNIPNYLYFYVA
jgi:hypothetical protein